MNKNKYKHQLSVTASLCVLRFSQFFAMFLPCLAIIILIYTQKGITVGDFFLIQGIFRLAAFLLEIPSGYLSDRFSRRHVLMFGAILHGIGFTTLALAHGFWLIVLGESLLGISSAMFSGTLEAYTYDLLKRNKTQKHFLKEMGSISTWGSAAAAIATIIGPEIYAYTGGNGNLLIWMSACAALFQFILYSLLPELSEVVRKKQKNKSAFMDVIGITLRTLRNAKLRNLIIFPALYGSFTIILFWALQPIMETSNIPVALFGIYIGINQFSRMLMSKYAYKICQKFGEINTSILTILSLVLSIVLSFVAMYSPNMTVVYIAVAIMAFVPATQKLNQLQYNSLIHHDIESKERGTVLSTSAMVGTLFGATMLAGAKYLLDYHGLETTLLATLFTTTLLIISLYKTKKYLCCSQKQSK